MHRPFHSKKLRLPGYRAWLIILIALSLEILLFNSQSFALLGSRTERLTIAADHFTLTGFTIDPDHPTVLKPDANVEHAIKLTGFNLNAETLCLNLTAQDKSVIKCRIYATDAAASSYYSILDDHQLVDGLARSRYIRLHLDGPSTRIKLIFELRAGQNIDLASISLNKPIPLHFSWLRFSLISALGLLTLVLRRAPLCRQKRLPGDRRQTILLVLTALLAIMISLVFATAAAGGRMIHFDAGNGDVYSRDLVDALSAGQFHLLIEPPAALAELTNPYDPGLRAASAIKGALWDVAYFDGKYYVYFGIVPALLLFLPFHQLTGLYLPSVWAVILFSVLALIFLMRLLDKILQHFFPELPFRFYLLASLTLAAGCNLWWCLSRPKFYEVAITGGLCFGIIGLYLLFRCWQANLAGRLRWLRLSAGCLFLAMAVGARPNLLLLSLLPLPLFWQLVIRPHSGQPLQPAAEPSPAAACRRARLRNILAICIPYLLIGGMLMLYNQLRFGSIAEFGANYQLTVTDMGARGFSPARIWPGLWYSLFNFPVINTTFPFLHFQNEPAFRFSGYFYTDSRCAGLLVTLPVCWLLLAWPWLRPALQKTPLPLRRLVLLLCLNALLITMVDSMAGGSAGRYLTDFAWLFVLSAILLAAALVQAAGRLPGAAMQHTLLSVFSLLCGLTVLAALLQALQGENSQFQNNNPVLYAQLERFVAFWLP